MKNNWLSLEAVLRSVPAMAKYKVSEVARGIKDSKETKEGFVEAYIATKGDPEKMSKRLTGRNDHETWYDRRIQFNTRHYGQVKKNNEKLWQQNGDPSRRHLGLIAWGWSPSSEHKRLERWLVNQPTMKSGEWKKHVGSQKRKNKTSDLVSDKQGRKIPKRYISAYEGKDKEKRIKEINDRRVEYDKALEKYGDEDNFPQSVLKKLYRPFKTDEGVKTVPSKYSEIAKQRGITGNIQEKQKTAQKYYGIKLPMKILKEVYAKGMGAWSSGGHRGGATSHAWAMARLNSFLVGGKTYWTADQYLARQLSEKAQKAIEKEAVYKPNYKNPSKLVKVAIHRLSKDGVHEKIGYITFSDSSEGLVAMTNLMKLPKGHHGFHIHEFGSIAPRYNTQKQKWIAGGMAGDHYDPLHAGFHGKPDGNGHLGDMPFITATKNGISKEKIVSPRLSLSHIINRSVIIHEFGDNYSDNPLPNGGGKVRMFGGIITNNCPHCRKK
jgi:Cu-Zn family superoxide dismutase